ncbi:sterol desaturase family protein [Ideonella sp.]|uniref:sterol desaturase family protein n=1 Tax=Ideonella sp. TaxID=1929293 RepID=UPI0035B18A6D
MRGLLTRHLYALAVGGSLVAFGIGRALGWPPEAVVLASSVLTLMAGAVLERWAPFDPQWAKPRDDVATDATSAVVLIGLVDPLLKAVLPVLAIALLQGVGQPGRPGWFLADAPFGVQVLAALLWVEFAKYWSHRAHHTLGGLWQLHALHHGSERLYWLNNFRFHPLNHALNALVSLLPLWLLGVPAEVLLGATALTQPVLMLQHANIDLRSGWLNRVFSTNELHRWHHSARPSEANSNFGSALVLWDHVFGTFRHPGGAARPARIGLFGSSSGYPARGSYLRQLLAVFMPPCCRA